jgi:hypothetical protein
MSKKCLCVFLDLGKCPPHIWPLGLGRGKCPQGFGDSFWAAENVPRISEAFSRNSENVFGAFKMSKDVLWDI